MFLFGFPSSLSWTSTLKLAQRFLRGAHIANEIRWWRACGLHL
jgi:hypothetical protein